MSSRARTGNPLTSSPLGGRLLSASQLPWFTALPPRNYGILTTTGRKTGKRRRRCIRAVRAGDLVYLVGFFAVCLWIAMRQMERKLIK